MLVLKGVHPWKLTWLFKKKWFWKRLSFQRFGDLLVSGVQPLVFGSEIHVATFEQRPPFVKGRYLPSQNMWKYPLDSVNFESMIGIILQNFIPPLRTKSSLVTVPSFHHLPSVQPTSYRSYAGNAIDFAWKSFLACCKTSLKLQSLSDHVGRVKFGVSPVRIQTSMTMTPQLRSDYHVNHLPFVLKLRWGRKTGQILFQFWALTWYRLWSQFWASRYESKTTL